MAGPPRHSIGRLLRSLIVSVMLAMTGAAAQADSDLLQHVERLLDPQKEMGIDAVRQADFIPSEETLMLGYLPAAIWLKLRVVPPTDGGEVVVLVRPPILDDVRFYSPVDPGADGAALEYREQPVDWPSSLRGYRINPPEGGADYYLRIASTGSITANITAQSRLAAVRKSLLIDLVQIIYFSVMLVLLLWSLRLLVTTRERLFGWYAAMQGLWLIHNFAAFGYASVLAPAEYSHTIVIFYRTLIIFAAIMSIGFHRAVLIRYKPATLAIRAFDLQLATMVVALLLFWLVDRQIGLKINAYCIAVAPFIFLLNAFTARQQSSPDLRTMRLIYGILSVVLMMWVFSLLGLSKITVFSLYGFMVHGMTTGLLMFIILHLHNRNLIADAQAAKDRLAEVENRRILEVEKTRTLAQFIDMLTHEARNALAVINMSISGRAITERQRERVATAMFGLSQVIERCNQTIRLDGHEQTITLEQCDLVEILQRLCTSAVDFNRLTLLVPDRLLMQSDPVLLGVVLGNMIDNALKYSPAGSKVSLVVDRQREGVSVLIENESGAAGMPDPDLVFEKYYRNHLAKAQTGSGLGLYIVRALVQLLGGTITYEPQDLRVRFRIWFPC